MCMVPTINGWRQLKSGKHRHGDHTPHLLSTVRSDHHLRIGWSHPLQVVAPYQRAEHCLHRSPNVRSCYTTALKLLRHSANTLQYRANAQ